jgi:hypothetical protein
MTKKKNEKNTFRQTRLSGTTRQQYNEDMTHKEEVKDRMKKNKRSIKQFGRESTEDKTYNHASERI